MIWRRVFIALLILTPLLAVVAPRAMSWWVGALGLCALTCRDNDAPIMWIAACVPLWAGFLSLCSIIWAAFPDVQFDLAIERLPMLYGLSLGIIGLGCVKADIWQAALPKMAWCFAMGVIFASIEYMFNFPLLNWFRDFTGKDNGQAVNLSVLNRGLTVLALLAGPALLYYWQAGRRYVPAGLILIFIALLSVSEASATFLGFVLALLVFVVAQKYFSIIRVMMMAGGAVMIMAMPSIAMHLWSWLPAWDWLDSPSRGGRLEIWHALGKIIPQAPIIGYGYEVTRFYPLAMDNVFFRQDSVLHPHNMALQAWVEFGAVGAVLLCALWVWACRHCTTPRGLAMLALTGVIGLLSYGMWQGTWLGLMVFAWLYGRASATVLGSNSQKDPGDCIGPDRASASAP